MTNVGLVVMIAGAVLVGIACQFVGRRRDDYEWTVATVGALYGGLLFNGVLGARLTPGVTVEGVYPIVALAGAALLGGLMLFAVRGFGSFIVPAAASQQATTLRGRRVRLSYAPALVEEPIIDRMRRQFGVEATVGRTDISGDSGWLELHIAGAPPAIDAALTLARRSGLVVLAETEELIPARAA